MEWERHTMSMIRNIKSQKIKNRKAGERKENVRNEKREISIGSSREY